MGKDRIAGRADQPQQSRAFDQTPRLANDQKMTPLQGQSECADDGETERMTAPPDAEAVQHVCADHGVQRQRAQNSGRQGRDGANGQETRQPLHGVHAQARYETSSEKHRQNNLQQVHRHEHDGQSRTVADQELACQHARHHQDAEPQIIGQAPAAPQPDSHRQTARAPEGGDQAVGPRETDRQHDQNGHADRRQDGRQRLSEKGGVGRRRDGADVRRCGVENGFSPVERSAHRHDRVRKSTRLTPHPAGPS